MENRKNELLVIFIASEHQHIRKRLCHYLDDVSLARLCGVSKLMKVLLEDQHLWKDRTLARFGPQGN